jgi:transcriptional regulator with XRE-family HTH domain
MDENEYKPEDWARLAAQVKQRRVALRMTQPQVHAAGGPSVSFISRLEKSRSTSYEEIALARLEEVLGWRQGSIHAILRGEDPQLLAGQTQRRPAVNPDIEELIEALPEDEKSVGRQILMAMGALQKEVADLRAEVRQLRTSRHEEGSDITESETDIEGQRGTRGA